MGSVSKSLHCILDQDCRRFCRNTSISNTPQVKFTVSHKQLKFTRHVPRQGHITHNKKNDQSLESHPEMASIIELATKDVDIVSITVFNMCRHPEKD